MPQTELLSRLESRPPSLDEPIVQGEALGDEKTGNETS